MSLKFAQLSKVLNKFARAGLVVFSMFMACSVNAADFEDGFKAYKAKDYKTAFQVWKLLADQGDAESQRGLGYLYKDGLGVIKDFEKGVKLWTLLADQGYAGAQYSLGNMHSNGDGVTQDYELAVKWFTLAAEQGDVNAQYSLAMAYSKGDGVTQDYELAVKWYTLAAEQGDVYAQSYLGWIFSYGQNVVKDSKLAAKWYTLAAEQGYASAQHSLGEMYQNGEGVTKDYKLAVKWYKLAKEQGIDPAPSSLKSLQNGMTDWSLKEKKANVILVNLEKSIKEYVTASVSYSSSGERSLYFRVEYDDLHCNITKDSDEPSTHIWHFNKQAVKMAAWCNKFPDTEILYVSLTPKTAKGFNFVVSDFRKAASTVSIKTDTLNFKMSAKGFTKVWNSISSEAL